LGISYKTAWRLWKDGKLNAFTLPTGTIIVNDLIEINSHIRYAFMQVFPVRKIKIIWMHRLNV
jgi:predicted site-specific integrase-resolvase